MKTFELQRSGASLVVTVTGDLDVSNRNNLSHAVQEEIDSGVKHLRLDFAACPYVDSSGLGVLVRLSRKIRDAGGERVTLSRLNSDLHTLFELTKLDVLFNIVESESPASGQYARVDGRSAR